MYNDKLPPNIGSHNDPGNESNLVINYRVDVNNETIDTFEEEERIYAESLYEAECKKHGDEYAVELYEVQETVNNKGVTIETEDYILKSKF